MKIFAIIGMIATGVIALCFITFWYATVAARHRDKKQYEEFLAKSE